MEHSTEFPVLLFSYGTLQDKAVQLANFGRELLGQHDAMLGYSQSWVEITDPAVLATSGKTHHPIVAPTTEKGCSVGLQARFGGIGVGPDSLGVRASLNMKPWPIDFNLPAKRLECRPPRIESRDLVHGVTREVRQ